MRRMGVKEGGGGAATEPSPVIEGQTRSSAVLRHRETIGTCAIHDQGPVIRQTRVRHHAMRNTISIEWSDLHLAREIKCDGSKIMRERIQNLSPRGEFFLVISVCFGYFTLSSVRILIRGIHEYRLTVPRLLWGILIEILLASVAAWILHVRGSTIRRFGLRFSWPFLLSAIPLFLASLALFWATLWCAVSVFPTARSVTAIKMVPAAPFALFLVFALVNSLFEEIAVTASVLSPLPYP